MNRYETTLVLDLLKITLPRLKKLGLQTLREISDGTIQVRIIDGNVVIDRNAAIKTRYEFSLTKILERIQDGAISK